MVPIQVQKDARNNPDVRAIPSTRAEVRLGIAPPLTPPQSQAVYRSPGSNQDSRQDARPRVNSEDQEARDPSQADYPDPLPQSSTQTEAAAHRRKTKEYTQEMFNTYKSTTMSGKDLSEDLITAFREHTIRPWQRPMVTAYWDFLKARGVHVRGGRGKNKKEELIKFLSRERHIAPDDEYCGTVGE